MFNFLPRFQISYIFIIAFLLGTLSSSMFWIRYTNKLTEKYQMEIDKYKYLYLQYKENFENVEKVNKELDEKLKKCKNIVAKIEKRYKILLKDLENIKLSPCICNNKFFKINKEFRQYVNNSLIKYDINYLKNITAYDFIKQFEKRYNNIKFFIFVKTENITL